MDQEFACLGAESRVGGGVLTFHIPCLFRTDPGVDLFVTGPINRPKDAISALSGVIETDWSPYTFTMNGPFRHLFPVQRGELEKLAPSLHRLSDNPDLEREHKLWPERRNTFNASLADPASKAAQDQWQKTYFRGKAPSGAAAPEGHRSRLRLCHSRTRICENAPDKYLAHLLFPGLSKYHARRIPGPVGR